MFSSFKFSYKESVSLLRTRQKYGLSLAPTLQDLIQISAKKWARSKWGSRGAGEAPIRTPSAGAVPAPQHGPLKCFHLVSRDVNIHAHNGTAWHSIDTSLLPSFLSDSSFYHLHLLGKGTWGEAAPVPRSCRDGTVSVLIFL